MEQNKQQYTHDVVTIPEAAERFRAQRVKISENGIRCLVRQRKIPARYVGGRYLIPWKQLTDWLTFQGEYSYIPQGSTNQTGGGIHPVGQ